MKPSKNTPTAETDEDDFLHATDDEGNTLSDEDVIAGAEAVETLEFKALGKNHRVEVRAIQVPGRLTNRLSSIGTKLALAAGFRPGDTIGGAQAAPDEDEATGEQSDAERANEAQIEDGAGPEAEATAPEGDERLAQLVALTDESEELRAVHAEIAAAAIVRDARGFARVSIPQFRADLTAKKLLDAGALGDAVIIVVRDWLRPT